MANRYTYLYYLEQAQLSIPRILLKYSAPKGAKVPEPRKIYENA